MGEKEGANLQTHMLIYIQVASPNPATVLLQHDVNDRVWCMESLVLLSVLCLSRLCLCCVWLIAVSAPGSLRQISLQQMPAESGLVRRRMIRIRV